MHTVTNRISGFNLNQSIGGIGPFFRTTASCFDESLHGYVCARDLKNEVAQDYVMQPTLGYLPNAPNREGNSESAGDQYKE
jgi:hypothetical protein